MKEITKFKCEFCNQLFDTKESVIFHENEHRELTTIPIKKIYYNSETNSFTVYCYPKAIYQETNDTIQLNKNYNFNKSYRFQFDKIQHNNVSNCENDLIVYTKNLDEEYEKELIDKIIDYKINELNELVQQIKALKTVRCIGRVDDSIW